MAYKIKQPKLLESMEPDDKKQSTRTLKIVVFILIIVVTLASVSVIVLINSGSNATLSRVEVLPKNSGDGDIVTITAYVDGGGLLSPKPRINFDVLFYSGEGALGGSYPMNRVNSETYDVEIGPYPEGTQIWYMITMPSSNGLSYNESTIDIGTVEYTDDIWIQDVDYSPKNLVDCSLIEISASKDHVGVISEMTTTYKIYHMFTPGGRSGSSSETDSGTYNPTTGLSTIKMNIRYYDISSFSDLPGPNETPDYEPFPSGTIIFYRFVISSSSYKFATPSGIITIP